MLCIQRQNKMPQTMIICVRGLIVLKLVSWKPYLDGDMRQCVSRREGCVGSGCTYILCLCVCVFAREMCVRHAISYRAVRVI